MYYIGKYFYYYNKISNMNITLGAKFHKEFKFNTFINQLLLLVYTLTC